MKKILITAVALALAVPAPAAQQDIAQISAVTASREALRTAINTQLSAVQSNFDEIYAVIDAGPVYVNASAPVDTKVVWIDTDQSNAIKVYVGGAWTVVGSGGEGSYTLPTAAADTLGGVKVGARLTITDGVLSADVQTGDGSATYPSAAGVANWGGSAWGTSYTVGTGASNLVQLNASAQLPAVSAALLTNFPTLNQNTTGTAGGLSGTPNITVGTISAGAGGFGVDADGDVTAKSVTVTRTTSPSAIDLYEGTGGGDNKLTLTISGNLAADATLNADQILATGDVDDTPVNGVTTAPVSSNWAYDHVAASDPHTGYVLESAIGTTVQGYDADLATWAGVTPSANGQSLVSAANYAAMRTLLDLEAGTDFNAYDADLAAWAAISPTGALDFGGSTSLEIPNGAAPTVDTTGEVAVDTTSDQLIYYGAAKRVLPYRLQENFAIKSPVDADDVLMFKAQQAITITDIHVLAQGGGTISVDIQECDSAGANCATVDAAISADSDGAEDDGTLSNGAIDAGDWVKLVLAAPSGTVNFLTGSIYYTITAD